MIKDYNLTIKGSFQAQHKTDIYWWIFFEKSDFTTPGYYVGVSLDDAVLLLGRAAVRQKTDLLKDSGAVKILVKECKRQSKKQLEFVIQEVHSRLPGTITEKYPTL